MLKRNWALIALIYLAFAEVLSWSPVPDLSLCLIQPSHDQKAADHNDEKYCPAFRTGVIVGLNALDGFLERHDKSVVGAFTIVLAISTIGLWLATNNLWRAGEKQIEFTGDSVAIAKDALLKTERAFVFLDGFNIELTTAADSSVVENEILPEPYRNDPGLFITRFSAQPRWKNSGTTPVKNMRISVNWRGPNGPIHPDTSDFTNTDDGVPFFLGPQATEPSDPIEMTGAMALVNWQWNPVPPCPKMFIWGRADYRDVFGQPHFTEWCYQLRLSRPIRSERMRAEFIQWGDYNRIDES
jgi:hypothetical protein